MKKIVLTVVAMLNLTSSVFAAPTEVDALATQKYVFNINTNKMSQALDLSAGQFDDVLNGSEVFAEETRSASKMKTEKDRKESFNKAIMRNLKYMQQVLTKEQYQKYLMLLNVTSSNRGLSL